MKPMANKKTIWITRTGVLLALLLALQWATLGTRAFAGQYITGSLVNCVLAVSALTAGLSSGLVIALLSPIFAYLLGIAPQLVVVPAIMAGNCALVLVLWAVGRGDAPMWRKAVAVVLAAVCKFVVLYLLDSRANTRENTHATTWVARRTSTCPTVFSPRSVPMLMQLSMMVPTPSMYRKKASRKKSTLRSRSAIRFMVRPSLANAARTACGCGWV